MNRAPQFLSLAVLGTALLAGCSDSGKSSSASTTPLVTKPAPATTSPMTTPSTAQAPSKTPAPSAAKPMANTSAPATTTTAAGSSTAESADAAVAEVAKIVDTLPPVPSQDEIDAAAQKAITDANADAEFDKLSKEIESDKP